MLYQRVIRTLFFQIFFVHDTATTEIYTLSLHDALPISPALVEPALATPAWLSKALSVSGRNFTRDRRAASAGRSEEHTSELQSRRDLVCRLLLEKKNNN